MWLPPSLWQPLRSHPQPSQPLFFGISSSRASTLAFLPRAASWRRRAALAPMDSPGHRWVVWATSVGSSQAEAPAEGAVDLHGSTAASLSPEASFADHGPALVVFSGGTAFNSVAGHVRQFTTRVTHVLPVSDDGGSTAEIVRVLGGPAVGDIRSRCLRLADDTDAEAKAVRELLAHRLCSNSSGAAKHEWYDIVEGTHPLWEGVSEPYKHTIRAFLVHFHTEILRHSTERFNFRNGSVGNFFFAGARVFFRSLEAAIFLFSRVARIPEGSLVLPAVCTEERLVLGAELTDGSVIRGQNDISHPNPPPGDETSGSEDGDSGPRAVDKSTARVQELPAAVRRIFYLSSEGSAHIEHEVAPAPNSRVLSELGRAEAVVYGMGSLYTSIAPSLILQGVGEAVAARECPKVLLLNGAIDRETTRGPAGPMTAADTVQALADALNRRHAKRVEQLSHPPSAYVTAVIVPQGCPIEVDRQRLLAMGVRSILEVGAHVGQEQGTVLYDPESLVAGIRAVVQAHSTHPQQHDNGALRQLQQHHRSHHPLQTHSHQM